MRAGHQPAVRLIGGLLRGVVDTTGIGRTRRIEGVEDNDNTRPDLSGRAFPRSGSERLATAAGPAVAVELVLALDLQRQVDAGAPAGVEQPDEHVRALGPEVRGLGQQHLAVAVQCLDIGLLPPVIAVMSASSKSRNASSISETSEWMSAMSSPTLTQALRSARACEEQRNRPTIQTGRPPFR